MKHMNLEMSYLQATEAILYCRGAQLDESKEFDFEKLLQWLVINIKVLRQA